MAVTVSVENAHEAAAEFRALTRAGLYGDIMVDRDTGKIWVSEHVDPNGYRAYEDPAIERIAGLATEAQRAKHMQGADDTSWIHTVHEVAQAACDAWAAQEA